MARRKTPVEIIETFVHIGDGHLNPRHAERLVAIDQIIAAGLELASLAAWLWPGDLFNARSTVEDRNALAARLVRMANAAPVVICYGNHDVPGDLDVFALLSAKWPIYVVSTPQVLTVPLATGRTAAIAVLPYPTRASLIMAGASADEVLTEAHATLAATVQTLGWALDDAAKNGLVPLAIGHVNVAGAVASCGQPQIGKEIELDQTMLTGLIPYYVGLNHIHQRQVIGTAQYAGSVCRMDWGETEPKSALRVDITPSGDWTSSFLDVDVPPLYHVEGTFSRETGFDWTVKKGPDGPRQDPPETWDGCHVRVRYTFSAADRGLFDDTVIRAPFLAAARLVLEPIAVPDHGLRSKEVAAAHTLGEQVAAWCVANDTEATPGLLAKLGRLEHGDSQDILADVSRHLAPASAEPVVEEGKAA